MTPALKSFLLDIMEEQPYSMMQLLVIQDSKGWKHYVVKYLMLTPVNELNASFTICVEPLVSTVQKPVHCFKQ